MGRNYSAKWIGEETLKAVILNWISRYGRPRIIIIYLGSNFDCHQFKEYMESNNTPQTWQIREHLNP